MGKYLTESLRLLTVSVWRRVLRAAAAIPAMVLVELAIASILIHKISKQYKSLVNHSGMLSGIDN